MTGSIDIVPEQYDAASRVFGDAIYAQLREASADVERDLAGCGAMAGSDPAGTQWAKGYDELARCVHSVLIDLETACLKIAVMLQKTGFNHGLAESASDPTKSTPSPADPAVYLPRKRVAPDLPSAQGGSISPPTGWWLVKHTVGYTWPNGHPDRLRDAGEAWSSCATAVIVASYRIPDAAVAIVGQQSPEVADAITVCSSMSEHIRDTAVACGELAKACSDFADAIDDAHRHIDDELVNLLNWIRGIEVRGILASLFPGSIKEGGAQAAEAARVGVSAGRIAKIISSVVKLAATSDRVIRNALSPISNVAQGLLRIERAEISDASVATAAKVPTITDTTEVAGTTEAAAVNHIETVGGQIQKIKETIANPKFFDPNSLTGMNSEELKNAIPSDWVSESGKPGEGMVFRDPHNPGRQIQIMPGNPKGNRPHVLTNGPDAVVSQNGITVRIPLEGNPKLEGN